MCITFDSVLKQAVGGPVKFTPLYGFGFVSWPAQFMLMEVIVDLPRVKPKNVVSTVDELANRLTSRSNKHAT